MKSQDFDSISKPYSLSFLFAQLDLPVYLGNDVHIEMLHNTVAFQPTDLGSASGQGVAHAHHLYWLSSCFHAMFQWCSRFFRLYIQLYIELSLFLYFSILQAPIVFYTNIFNNRDPRGP